VVEMKVSVIVPTKNEPKINDLVKEIHKQLSGINHEIIVVDKSITPPKIKNVKMLIQKSDGLGKAVKEGVKVAKGDVIVTMDADFSHRPEDIKKLLEKTKDYDIVIGSRFVEGGKTKDIVHRKITSFAMRKLASLVLGLPVKDTMSGFSAVRSNVYKKIRLNPIGYKINMEILYKGKKRGFKIAEVPIVFCKRKYGKSKVGMSVAGVKEVFRILIYMIKLKTGSDR
jgi:dolichol-phosphate mannosyltransferase